MKNFWGSFFGTLVGVIVTSVILFFIVVAIFVASLSGLSAKKDKPYKVKSNSILHISFDSEIIDRGTKNPFEYFNFSSPQAKTPIGLNDVLENIEKAKEDNSIKGIYLDISSIQSGVATLEEIRNALLDFKSSGKFIVAYSEVYEQSAYYLSTVADKIYLNPEGMLEFKGLSSQVMFFKKLFEKLDVQMQIFRHGKFKSASEPFFLDRMSKENREQIMTYIGSIWNYILEGISTQRKISVADLNRYADNMLITDAESAFRYKLVDRLLYKDQLLDTLKNLSGAESAEKLNFVSLRKYFRAPGKKEITHKDKIAVIYAIGGIEGGEGDGKTIGSERISKAVREARLNENVKAIVLRVNSPGGSALASDVIWREMVLAKQVKPVVVSMGNVAASGGYYIACAADAILANPNTITGSIGVFGLFPNAKGFYENKLGITVDTVNTNKHSDIMSVYRPVAKDEGEVIQKWIEDTYTDFIAKVGEGRGMTPAQVDEIGQGRVWSGIDAKKIGLIDEFGGIKEAITLAAQKAKLENYSLLELPLQKEPFEEILKNIMDEESVTERMLRSELGSNYDNYLRLKTTLRYKGIQMRMPYDIVIY